MEGRASKQATFFSLFFSFLFFFSFFFTVSVYHQLHLEVSATALFVRAVDPCRGVGGVQMGYGWVGVEWGGCTQPIKDGLCSKLNFHLVDVLTAGICSTELSV